MDSKPTPVFKTWAPEWLIRGVILMVVIPSMALFGLSTANGASAAGYYGIEPADVQYSMVIFYAAVASFFALERRFFIFIAVREYLIISTIVQIITSYICYTTHNLHELFIFRFIQGMANCASTSICITLIFNRLHGERAREIGYSVFYCILLMISPLTTLLTAPILDDYDFNVLYKGIIFFYLPGTLLLFLIMNNVRLNRKFPLYQVDWASFIIYALALCLIGYVLIYGQQYYWLHDTRIAVSVVAIVLLLALHVVRQAKLKRPYLSLEVFKYKNYVIGAFLVFILYICRGAFNITSGYFASAMGMDPIHLGYILLANMAGIVLGVIVSSRLVVMKKPMRLVWLYGFVLLLLFHLWMRFLFASQANAETYIIPLMVQGLGAGLLMTPLIVFMVSSVPMHLGGAASATGVFFRFTGFCSSIALINYFQLEKGSTHFNRFQQELSEANPIFIQRVTSYRQLLIGRGMPPDQAARLANGLVNRSVAAQAQLRYAMDYYYLISWILVIVILIIALYPYINRTIVNVRANQPAPASY
ncbi:MFS transporter [Mucilaginibacter sp. Bleaf8]|uniref:MFS transporter n=1 Tax=Mucilaginibacter sp. Bleaf8 TaxID=2834430 RepID=UPI001BCE2196|nr:MFS transporter [Mucilaginibacter sp. Bleaf8]MBS7563306.1 MFS transporter [Mucilaginibacter sp. Bleaf8]